jgi:hypothetical protein
MARQTRPCANPACERITMSSRFPNDIPEGLFRRRPGGHCTTCYERWKRWGNYEPRQDPRTTRRLEIVEDVIFMAEHGEHPENICRRAGIPMRSMYRYLQEANRQDLADHLYELAA